MREMKGSAEVVQTEAACIPTPEDILDSVLDNSQPSLRDWIVGLNGTQDYRPGLRSASPFDKLRAGSAGLHFQILGCRFSHTL
jgi:hypothetical protein